MNTLETNIRILEKLTTVAGDIAEELRGDSKDELDELIEAIETGRLQTTDRAFILENLVEARGFLTKWKYNYAATNLNRVARTLWRQVLGELDQGAT